MSYTWQYEETSPTRSREADELAAQIGVHPVVCRLLLERGIATPEAAKAYFRPSLQDIGDPFLMKDMDKAVARLNKAMGNKERILIYGDYDVDGCTAVALVYRFLQQYYSNIDYYIPDRYDEGYGLSQRGIDYARQTGVKLVIILDCGIKAHYEIAYARELGIDFIICDHHVPDAQLPPAAAILNAKRPDETYPYRDFSGCGVGFKFMQGFAISNAIPFSQLIPLLELVAVSIAADIVPIMGENRILAYHGLRQLSQSPGTGMRAVIDLCGLSGREITMSDIIFKIGPRINASGRILSGKVSVDLLVEHSYSHAAELAKQINAYNEERKELDKRMTEEASAIVSSMDDLSERAAIVIYNESWHKGVIGIVALRLTEAFCRPAVVLTRAGDVVTGSVRSTGNFDIYLALQHCQDLLLNFGGHTYAAGLSLSVDNVQAFAQRFEQYVATHIVQADAAPSPILHIDALLSFSQLTRKLQSDLRRMRPFGPDNETPIFATKQVYDFGTSKVVGRQQEHIKLELVEPTSANVVSGIAFQQSQHARYIKSKRAFDIAYSVEENSHKHGEMQLLIQDIRTPEMP